MFHELIASMISQKVGIIYFLDIHSSDIGISDKLGSEN